MSHKEEAVEAIGGMGDGRNLATDGGLLPLIHATLALVEAQERANEQARIANLIALATSDVHEVVGDYSLDPALEALMQLVTTFPTGVDDEVFGFAPDVARALGIGGAE